MPLIKKHEAYFISAGEHSGDLLGADLVLTLREKFPKLKAFGVAGDHMLRAGVHPIASTDDFSVMGVAEVAKKLPALRMLETQILHNIDQCVPQFAVLIDNPGFHLRLAEQLRLRGIKVFQYVAPKIWAWGEKRAASLRENIDMILGILPFEEEFFRKRGINYQYVGSPLKDRTDKVMIRRESLGLQQDQTMIACLPGSRDAEVRRILPVILSVQKALQRQLPKAQFVVPVAANLDWDDIRRALGAADDAAEFRRIAGDEGAEVYEAFGLRFVRGMSLEVMAAADAAIVASGTATLECALLGTPMVVVYVMNELTYQIARRVVQVSSVSLVNLLAGEKLVPEFIQDFSIKEIADQLAELVCDSALRKKQIMHFEEMRDKLKGSAAENAANAIVNFYGEQKLAGSLP